MAKQKLLEYPIVGDESDLELTRAFSPSRRGNYIGGIGTKGIKGKGVVVYLTRIREGNKPVDTYERDLIICGYRKTNIWLGKRIRLISPQEREFVKSRLLQNLSKENFSPEKIEFWSD